MIYEPGSQKVCMAGDVPVPLTRLMMVADEPKIKRTRKILMIILGVCVVSNRRAATLIMYSKRRNLSLLESLGDLCDPCHIWALRE
jgi:hypothetical protein